MQALIKKSVSYTGFTGSVAASVKQHVISTVEKKLNRVPISVKRDSSTN